MSHNSQVDSIKAQNSKVIYRFDICFAAITFGQPRKLEELTKNRIASPRGREKKKQRLNLLKLINYRSVGVWGALQLNALLCLNVSLSGVFLFWIVRFFRQSFCDFLCLRRENDCGKCISSRPSAVDHAVLCESNGQESEQHLGGSLSLACWSGDR